MKTKILLADDHAVLRDGIRFMLESQGDMTVVGDASDGREAVKKAAELKPDIVVIDIAMPFLNGIEATEQIIQQNPAVKVIILSMHSTSDHVHRALQAGALGYLLKESAGKELIDAIRRVAAGKRCLSAKINETIIDDYIGLRPKNSSVGLLERLSAREREIMQLVVEGHSSSQIGKTLHLSSKTIDTYRSRLMQKLNVSDITGLVKLAVQLGITRPE